MEHSKNVSMAVDLGGVKMKNPVNTASGTFGFGWQFEGLRLRLAVRGLLRRLEPGRHHDQGLLG